MARAFGALFEFGPLRFARRHTFLIDPHGCLARIYRNVRPVGHCEVVIADLAKLAAVLPEPNPPAGGGR